MLFVYIVAIGHCINVPENKHKLNTLQIINKKPILASEQELKKNKQSRSAKLRYAIKINEPENFESEVYEKFEHLINIENLSEKL